MLDSNIISPAWEQYLETRKQLKPEEREKLDRELNAYYRDVQVRAYGISTQYHAQRCSLPALHEEIATLPLSSSKPKEQVTFLDLPGEIRNEIYRCAYLNSTPLNGIDDKIPGIWLLALSKQVHKEASSILYSENVFLFGLDIDWNGNAEIVLVGFPRHIPIWPAPTYFPYLKKLHIRFKFKFGAPTTFEGPEIHCKQLQAMRDAYDDVWDDLDCGEPMNPCGRCDTNITYDFTESDLSRLTFTMAWLKFRFFEPITHPECTVITNNKTKRIVKWCLENTLRGMEVSDLKEGLEPEQLEALKEASEIAEDSYDRWSAPCADALSQRLAWGAPFDHGRSLFGLPTPAHLLSPAGLVASPFFASRGRIYSEWQMLEPLGKRTRSDLKSILLKDNELRLLAALSMPEKAKKLNVKSSCELRTYFALQESAMKMMALTRSIGDDTDGEQRDS